MWTAIVAIVAIVFIAEVFKNRGKQKHKAAATKATPQNTTKLDELEQRIQSLETIILELEKENRFRDLK